MRFKKIPDQEREPSAAALSRRDWLIRAGSLAAATTFAPFSPGVFGQTDTLQLKRDTVLPRRRVAFVVGNAAYVPENRSILCSRKNAADVSDALRALRFEVTTEIDQSTQGMRALLRNFFAAARSDASSPTLALFYYSGHGIQYRGKNFMVPSDVPFTQTTERIAQSSINIDDEMMRTIEQAALPNGDFALVFDACRTDPTAGGGDRDGQNQVVPPRGTVISFSTAPGKNAIAPKAADQNSFYTAALVQELRKASPQMSIKDSLDAVRFRVNRTMRESSEEFLRTHAQDPEVAANLTLRMSLAIDAGARIADDAERKAWAEVERTTEPAELASRLNTYLSRFKDGAFSDLARLRLEQVTVTLRGADRIRVRIEDIGNADFKSDQQKAVLESDKFAALRVAQAFERGLNGVPRDEQKMLQWLRYASDLKNGIASYQLYRVYLARQIDREAVRFRKLAIDQGYTPPPELDNRRG